MVLSAAMLDKLTGEPLSVPRPSMHVHGMHLHGMHVHGMHVHAAHR